MLAELPMQSVRDRVLTLRSMTALSLLQQRTLILVAEHARPRVFATGDVVIAEGKPIEAVHMIVEGSVTATRQGKLLGEVKRGFGVGFLSLLARDDNGIHAVANEPTHTLELASEVLLNAYEESFDLVRNGIRLQAVTIVRRRGDLPANPARPPEARLGTYRERERTIVEKMLQIRTSPLFARANLDAVAELARSTTEVRYPPDTYLWRIGDPSSFSLQIDYGRVRCSNRDGQSLAIGAGYTLGVLDGFSGQPRSYDARTETEVIAYRAHADRFFSVLESHFDVAMELLGILAKAQLPT